MIKKIETIVKEPSYTPFKVVEEVKVVKEVKKEPKLVKYIVRDNSANSGWNVGDTVEVLSDSDLITKGYLEEVK